MKKVFVFCIGGTGLRVMKSIIMLMAAGADTKGYTVIPIIVDPHMELNEKKDLHERIDRYIRIYNAIVTCGGQKMPALEGFFSSEMMKLKDLNNEKNNINELGGKSDSFGDFLEKGKITEGDINNYFVETLFSQSSLVNPLDVGFKGNPNVGTVVLGDMIEGADWFEAFKRNCSQGDRVFIISSIFGGTGASGYPLIEKKIRACADYPTVQGCLMGALTVLPYFNLEDPAHTSSDIDSKNFITKAKSALAYYENTVQSDYLYYIGEQSKTTSYANNEKEQEDKAHFVELVGATALFDFLKKDKPQNGTEYLSRAIADDVDPLDLKSCGSAYKGLVEYIANFMLLKLLVETLTEEKHYPLSSKHDRGLDKEFYGSADFNRLKEFLSDFDTWYQQLVENKRGFAPLNSDNTGDLTNWVKGSPLKAKNVTYYLLEMIKASHREKTENHSNKFRYFLKYAYEAIHCYTSNIQA